MVGTVILDSYAFDNPPDEYKKEVMLSNSPVPHFQRFISAVYQSDAQNITATFKGDLSLSEQSDLNELTELQNKAINGGKVSLDFDPFISGRGVIEDDSIRQESNRSRYNFTVKLNALSLADTHYPDHATPTTGNTFEWGGFNFGYDPDSVREEYERQTPSVDTLQGINRIIDTKGLITRVEVSGRIDGGGQRDLFNTARKNVMAYLNAEFQKGWALPTRLTISNDPAAPDFLTGLFRYTAEFLIVKDPANGIGQVSEFIDHDVRDLGTYNAESDSGVGTPEAGIIFIDNGSCDLNGQTTTFPSKNVRFDLGGVTNYIYVVDPDGDGNGELRVNQSGYPNEDGRFGRLVTDSKTITNTFNDQDSSFTGGAATITDFIYSVSAGSGSVNGDYVEWDNSEVIMPNAGDTFFIYADPSQSTKFEASIKETTSGFPSDTVSLWEVYVGATGFGSLTDQRDNLIKEGEGVDSDLVFEDNFGIDDRDISLDPNLPLAEPIPDPAVTQDYAGSSTLPQEPISDPSESITWEGQTSLSDALSVNDGGTASGKQGTTTTKTWSSASDWNSAVSEKGVVHEGFASLPGEDTIQLGYPSFDRNGSDLRGFWTMDDTSGDFADHTGNGYDATNQGMTQGVTGLHNLNAADHNGGYASLPNTVIETTPSTWTFALWFKGGSNGWLWELREGHRCIINIGRASSGELGVRWGGSNATDIGFGVFPGNSWNFLIMTYDGSNLIAEYNGSEVYNATEPSPVNQNDNNNLGSDNTAWTGDAAYYRLWKRSLSATERQEAYDTGKGGQLTTASKTFSTSVKPDLQNLVYNLNTKTINVDVIGSPNTASEEVKTVTLTGATSYSISWANAHTEFQVRPKLSTDDVTVSPTISKIELVSTTGGTEGDQNPNTTWELQGAKYDTQGHEAEGGGVVSRFAE